MVAKDDFGVITGFFCRWGEPNCVVDEGLTADTDKVACGVGRSWLSQREIVDEVVVDVAILGANRVLIDDVLEWREILGHVCVEE